MSDVVNLDNVRLGLKVKKGFKSWSGRFNDTFGMTTRMKDIKDGDLQFLADGNRDSSFYLYDLIINIIYEGSGYEFEKLAPLEKIAVIDIQLFLLERLRYEYMKRLGWIACYSGEEYTLVEMIINFNDLAPGIQATPPELSSRHPGFREYLDKNPFEKEEIIRKLIPEALNMALHQD